ncbi:MAG TPA: hypothetical protein VNH11_02885 [Pirellulales bacterium]|nr:hypothetical protein [Pirellulales bacterium]
MSEVRLVVRDASRDISGNCHGSLADRVVAALSAEPETIEELDRAIERFHFRDDDKSFLAWFSSGIRDEPYDAGLVVIDLAARLLAYESTYSSFGHDGSVAYHDGKCATQLDVCYHLPDDWVILHDVSSWQIRADELRQRRLAQPPLDARAILYGRPLLEFIATACFETFGRSPRSDDRQTAIVETKGKESLEFDADDPDRYGHSDYDRVREIHERWLTTPRDDLRGETPRDRLFANRDFLTSDLQDRENQWSFQGRCPPPLDRESHAYRFAGIGIHEWVHYYYLLRRLIWSCHDQVREQAGKSANWHLFSPGDFLTSEVPRLAAARDGWLDSPDHDLSGRTPRQVNDNERRRVPEAVSGHDAMVDDDCPLCDMMADLPGPMFWHLDGCNMDEGFAFSYLRTREEWETEQREWEELDRRLDEEQAAKDELEVRYPADVDVDTPWGYTVRPSENESVPLRLFAIGSDLAKIVVELKQPPEDRPSIDALKRDFGNLREVAQTGDLSLAAALIEPVLDRFCGTLSAVAASHEPLAKRCGDLSQRLHRFLRPLSDEPGLADDDDSWTPFDGPIDDDDIPF